MQDESKNRVGCSEFEDRLFDLLEGTVAAAELAQLRVHAEGCTGCGPLWAQAEAGKKWLGQLAVEEAPAKLVHNILARTSLAGGVAESKSAAARPGWLAGVVEWLTPVVRGVMQPRFAMTAAMSFFSISMLLNVGGVSLRDLKRLDLRPRALTMQASLNYYEMQAKVTRYYDNIRLVYEVQSSFSDIKKSEDVEQQDRKKLETPKSPDNSSKVRKQHSSSSGRDENSGVLPAMTELAAAAGQGMTINLEEVAQ